MAEPASRLEGYFLLPDGHLPQCRELAVAPEVVDVALPQGSGKAFHCPPCVCATAPRIPTALRASRADEAVKVKVAAAVVVEADA